MTHYSTLVDDALGVNPQLSRRIVEQSVIQGKVIESLDRSGLLDTFVLRGGNAIAGCYDGIRLSEDLDFASQGEIDRACAEAFHADIEGAASDELGVELRVERPNSLESGLVRWTVSANTTPERPDLPHTRVKVEAARIASHSANTRAFGNPALSSPSPVPPIVLVESPTELIADKIVSFTMTPRYLRYRDLFDIEFLRRGFAIDLASLPELVMGKIGEYGIENAQERFDAVCQLLEDDDVPASLRDHLDGMLATEQGRSLISSRRQVEAIAAASLELISSVTVAIGLGTLNPGTRQDRPLSPAIKP